MTNSMETQEYRNFVEKFKPKKTTDDCYTPPNIYSAVLGWVTKEYGIDQERVLRPFWPGGDYENADYPDGYTVVDNPPFSIFAKICKFYEEHEIPFFLFSPYLTALNLCVDSLTCVILTGESITYENGARVATAFRTNLDENLVRTAPELSKIIAQIDAQNNQKRRKQLPKYEYPDAVFTATMGGYMAKHGIEFKLGREDAVFIRRLDSQHRKKKTVFGGGLLLSESAAARNAAAHKWELSERELKIIKEMEGR